MKTPPAGLKLPTSRRFLAKLATRRAALLLPLGAALLANGPSARAAALYYDGGTNTWVNTSFSTDPAAATPDPASAPGIGDDITFNISTNNAVANVLSLGGNQAANSLTFSNTLANTIRSTTADETLTLGASGGVGMTVNTGAGAVTIGSTTAANRTNVILGASQNWTNNATTAVTINNGVAGTAAAGNTQTLTLGGSGTGLASSSNNAWIFTGNTTALTDGTGGGALALTLNTTATGAGGSVTLASANSYTGGTTITRGRITGSNIASFGTGLVTVQSSGAGVGGQALLGAATGIYANDFSIAGNGNGETNQGYAIRFSNGTTLGNAAGTNTLTIASTGASIGANTTATYTINSKITGSGVLTLVRGGTTGTNTAVFANANNDYTGQTTIGGNTTLQLNAATAAQNSVISIGQANGLTFNGITAATIGGLAGAQAEALTNIGGGAVALTIGNNNNTGMSYGGVLSGTGSSVIKVGTGTQTFTGVNTAYTGTYNIQNGVLLSATGGTVANSGLGTGVITLGLTGSGNSAGLQMSNAGKAFSNAIATQGTGTNTIQVTGGGQTFTLTGGATLNGNLTLSTIGGTDALAVTTTDITGTGNLVTSVNTGTSITGATGLATGGAITISSGVNNVGTVTNNGSGTAAVTISGVIGANVTGVTQNSASSRLVLTGNNLYAGGTTVNAGTLLVNNTAGSGTGSGAVTVNNSTLGGSGTINVGANTLTVNAGSTLAPGNSPGILTVVGTQTASAPAFGGATLSLAPGANLAIELNGATPGNTATSYDQIVLTGNVNLAGANLTLSLGNGFNPVGTTFTIIDNDTAVDLVGGTFASSLVGASNDTGSYNFTVNYTGGDGNNVTLTASPVPEPGTWVMMVGGGLLLVGLQGRRRRHQLS